MKFKPIDKFNIFVSIVQIFYLNSIHCQNLRILRCATMIGAGLLYGLRQLMREPQQFMVFLRIAGDQRKSNVMSFCTSDRYFYHKLLNTYWVRKVKNFFIIVGSFTIVPNFKRCPIFSVTEIAMDWSQQDERMKFVNLQRWDRKLKKSYSYHTNWNLNTN